MSDYIDRQAVKDWLLRWEGYIDKDTITRMQYRVIDIPSVEVESIKHGRWSHYYDDVLVSGTCSICGWQSMVLETDVADMPYCPNCGAKMDIDEGEEE